MSRRTGAVVVAIVALLAGAAAAQAATPRFVATGGSDTANTCSVATSPCLTIGHAVAKAAPGDFIFIGPGTFKKAVKVGKVGLTFVGAGSTGAGQTFVDASGTMSPGFTVGGESTTFVNLHIRGGNNTGLGGGVEGAIQGGGSPAPAIAIAGCVLDEASPAHPMHWDTTIQIEPGTAALTISSTTIAGLQGGIAIGHGAGGSLRIDHSTITEPFVAVPTGLHLVGGSMAAVLTEVPTTITDSALSATDAIDVEGTQVSTARTVIHASHVGVTVVGGHSASVPSLTMRDSVVAPGGGALIDGIVVHGIGPSATPEAVSLTGVSILALSKKHPRALAASNAAPHSTIEARNSILQAIDPSATTDEDITGATTVTGDLGFTAFTTAKGAGVPAPGSGTNIDAAPQFADEVLGDLQLQSTSPLFDRGDPSQVQPGETDVTGAPRAVDHDCDGVAQPDLGAYEAPGPTCSPGSPAAPPPPPPPPATKDTTPPDITSLAFEPTHFSAADTHPPAGVHHESTLRFTLSEAATLKVDVERVVHHSGGHPATYTIIGSSTYHDEKSGADTRTFSGLIGGHPLHSAEYRAIVIAADAAGNVSLHHHLFFTIED